MLFLYVLSLWINVLLPPGRYPQASTTALTEASLAAVPVADWQLLINEVYARHGYPFKEEAVRQHFTRQPWYQPRPAPTPLTSLEKQNISLVRQVQRHGYTGFDAVLVQFGAVMRQHDASAWQALVLPGAQLEPSWLPAAETSRLLKALRNPAARTVTAEAPESAGGRLCSVLTVPTSAPLPTGEGGGGYQFYFTKVFSKAQPQGRWYLAGILAAG